MRAFKFTIFIRDTLMASRDAMASVPRPAECASRYFHRGRVFRPGFSRFPGHESTSVFWDQWEYLTEEDSSYVTSEGEEDMDSADSEEWHFTDELESNGDSSYNVGEALGVRMPLEISEINGSYYLLIGTRVGSLRFADNSSVTQQVIVVNDNVLSGHGQLHYYRSDSAASA